MSANPIGWADTPAVMELLDAARECGLVIDPLAQRERDWHLDPFDLLRLHRAWSAKMRARCGLSETQPGPKLQPNRAPAQRAERGERTASILAALPVDPAFAVGIKTLVRRMGLGDAHEHAVRTTIKVLVERGRVARVNQSSVGVRRGAVRNADRQQFYRVAA